MPPVPRAKLEALLCEVQKPVRYIGNEWNSVVRDGPAIDYRVALAYPDAYEIGMSHLGFRILYSLLNKKASVAAERVFAPWPDMEAALRKHGVPLYSLETKTPLGELDLLGFSLQYEMTLTNVLLMLDLAGVPLLARDRTDGHPLVVAGGPVAMAPEPFADFFDLVAVGDGEELFPEIIDRARELRDGGADRATVVAHLGQVPGMYAPAYYRLEEDALTGLQVVAGSDTHPFPVKRRILMDLGRHPFPQDVIVPFCEIVHSRVAVEIMRGCNVGCRFCQAGYIYRPERIRTADQVVEAAIGSSRRTGFDEVSLTSLNTGEYPQIENVLSRLMDTFETTTTAVSLPSLRASSLTGGLLDEIDRVRKSGLTIAPEGGTQRMRDVINKNISEADIEKAAHAAFSHRWNLIKLYFMIGQPTEREEDVVGIAETAKKVLRIGQGYRGSRAKVNLGVSSFIPKPFTPFQWAPMEGEASLLTKQSVISRTLTRTKVKFGRHEVHQSRVESAFSRGDRRVGGAILRAYRAGARFDGWLEWFDAERWRKAFADEGLDLGDYAHREFPLDAKLPWDHVDIGVRKSFLRQELEHALAAHVVSICATDDCHGCGSFIKECLSDNASHGREFPSRRPRGVGVPSPTPARQTYRAVYEKSGWTRFISHLDVARTLGYAFRRAELPLTYTGGFHPNPKFTFGPPLPLGFEGRGEVLDLSLDESIPEDELCARVNAQLPPGLRFHDVRMLGDGAPKLWRSLNAALYSVELTEDDLRDVDLPKAMARLLDSEHVLVRKKHKGEELLVDIRAGVISLEVDRDLRLRAALRIVGRGNARPDDVLRALLGRRIPLARVVREKLLEVRDGVLLDPLACEPATAA